ncbi:hypothetical protein ACM66B_006670 [Microbotryomycetes sp. NB124-2]
MPRNFLCFSPSHHDTLKPRRAALAAPTLDTIRQGNQLESQAAVSSRVSTSSHDNNDASSVTAPRESFNLIRRATASRRKSASPRAAQPDSQRALGHENVYKRLQADRRVSKDMIGTPTGFEHVGGAGLVSHKVRVRQRTSTGSS